MLRNITLSADEKLIEKARKSAERENKSFNIVFREWLERYVKQHTDTVNYSQVMKKLTYARSGKTFTREEMNAR